MRSIDLDKSQDESREEHRVHKRDRDRIKETVHVKKDIS